MSRDRTILLIIVFLAILFLGTWTISSMPAAPQNSTQALAPSVTIDLPLALRHTVEGDTHTYNGSVWLPNTCATLSSGLVAQGMHPAHLTLSVSSNDSACSDAAKTQADFSVSYTGTDSQPPVIDTVTFNAMEIPFTLIEGN